MNRSNERSRSEYGVARECRRGLVRGMGYTEEEFKRPIIAVVNSWNEYNPGHVHLRTLAERVKQGIREAGGLPFEMMTTGICDGMVLKNPRYIETAQPQQHRGRSRTDRGIQHVRRYGAALHLRLHRAGTSHGGGAA